MRKTLIVVGIVVVALAATMSIVNAMSPSDEVVVLTSVDASGAPLETSLWIVEEGDTLWLRAGNPESSWMESVRANPEVQLERGEQIVVYRAVPVDEDAARERVNSLMAEKYGASNSLVSIWGDHSISVPIRLEPSTAVGTGPR